MANKPLPKNLNDLNKFYKSVDKIAFDASKNVNQKSKEIAEVIKEYDPVETAKFFFFANYDVLKQKEMENAAAQISANYASAYKQTTEKLGNNDMMIDGVVNQLFPVGSEFIKYGQGEALHVDHFISGEDNEL